MKKYIVLSVNDNVDYLYFTPLTCWAWRKFGWEPIVMFQGDPVAQYKLVQRLGDVTVYGVKPIEGYRFDTITQISRLYGSMVLRPTDYAMTGDIDMLPLSNYWKVPEYNQDLDSLEYLTIEPTVWGHDLTGFGHFPICYIGMTANKWDKVMRLNMPNSDYNKLIKRDLDTLPQAKDTDFYKYWFSDQDLITARLKEYGTDKIYFINRGQGKHGYARGRVDRGNGGWVLDQPELIDAHLQQQTHHDPNKINRLLELLHHVWPSENFDWFVSYTEEFKRLAK